jgi:methylmalonyl-CoA mutase
LKHTGEYPLVGVKTFIAEDGEEAPEPELTRATKEEKDARLRHLNDFHSRHAGEAAEAQAQLQQVARDGGNVFAELLRTVKSCSLGQISSALYEVGGQYRRSM